MEKSRLCYAVLWVVTVIAFSVPWVTADAKAYTGWSFVVPFSATYLIGILLGLIVLLTKRMPFALTIAAGVLMILGVIISMLSVAIMGGLIEFLGGTVTTEAGMGFAFIMSIVYLVGGALLGKRMKNHQERA